MAPKSDETKIVSGHGKRRRRDSNRWEDDSGESEVDQEILKKKEKLAEADTAPAASSESVDQAPSIDIQSLRQKARENYIMLRTDKQIQVFEAKAHILEEDCDTYGFENLTKHEQDELLLNREILGILADKTTLANGIDGYQLPEEYKARKQLESLLYSKNNRSQKDKNLTWEEQQISKVQKTSIDVDSIALPDSDKYEFVFDRKIDFITDTQLDLLEEEDQQTNKPSAAQEAMIQKEKARIKTMEEVRRSLPVYQYREQLLAAIEAHQVLIIVGETGSGKTTQLPQYLHEAGYTKNGQIVGCTQPRRVAATAVAARVSDEMGVPLGMEVGYSIRFEDKSTDKTVIKYMTDGMLLREFLADPELTKYSALIIDEAHERTMSTDILLSLCKDICKHRADMRLIIASATINAQKFSEYFDEAPIFNIPGRRYPVDIYYTQEPEPDYIKAAITTVFQIHTSQDPNSGDILVFLTGQDEIESMAESLLSTANKLGDQINELLICPIYANLPAELQAKIFEPTPHNARKVVLATNIAETSITIDGVVYVVDSGFVKENVFNPATGMESLVIVPSSKASVDQRAGRAGRVGPGKCFRLFTRWAFENELPESTTPELLRANLTSVVLLLLSLGINDLIHFDFMDAPSTETLIRSLELLYALGAMNEAGQLTKLGRQMSEFPADPMVAKAILYSSQLGCVEEIITIVSMLSESGSLFYRPKDKREQSDQAKNGFNSTSGDHISLLAIYEQWADVGYSYDWCRDNFLQYKTLIRAKNVRDQLHGLCERLDLFKEVEEMNREQKILKIQKAVAAGFFANTARLTRTGDSYKSVKKQQSVHIHPSSALFRTKPPPKLVIYNELVLTSKEFMRNVMIIKEEWLAELAPHFFNRKELDEIDTNTKRMPKIR